MKIKNLITITSNIISYLLITKPVLAISIGIGQPEDVKVTEFNPLIQGIIRLAFILAVILVFVFLIWGGIQWILSGGDKTKYEEARNRITAALVGLAIVALAWLIAKLVTSFFGLPDLFGNASFELPKGYQ